MEERDCVPKKKKSQKKTREIGCSSCRILCINKELLVWCFTGEYIKVTGRRIFISYEISSPFDFTEAVAVAIKLFDKIIIINAIIIKIIEKNILYF